MSYLAGLLFFLVEDGDVLKVWNAVVLSWCIWLLVFMCCAVGCFIPWLLQGHFASMDVEFNPDGKQRM